MFVVWSSNDGLFQSLISKSLERADARDLDLKATKPALKNYFDNPSVVVSINNNDKFSFPKNKI
jgi:hypothetical protein